MCYGERIKCYIDSIGVKQQKIAELTGIPANTLSTMLSGKRQIRIDEYVAICNALNVSVEMFATDETKTV